MAEANISNAINLNRCFFMGILILDKYIGIKAIRVPKDITASFLQNDGVDSLFKLQQATAKCIIPYLYCIEKKYPGILSVKIVLIKRAKNDDI